MGCWGNRLAGPGFRQQLQFSGINTYKLTFPTTESYNHFRFALWKRAYADTFLAS
jgi:hypothetical protein